jgi:hypothetical protein
VNIGRRVSFTALLHFAIRGSSRLDEALKTLRIFHALLQHANHEGMRTLSRLPGEASDSALHSLRQLQAGRGQGHLSTLPVRSAE